MTAEASRRERARDDRHLRGERVVHPVRVERKETAKAAAKPTVAATHVDYPLVAILATLLAVGLVMVYSASLTRAQWDGAAPTAYFQRQAMWVIVGLVAMAIMAAIPHDFWRKMAIPVMLLALMLLVAVLVFGTYKHGATRTLFNGSVQPSEFVKLAVVIYVAAWISSRGKAMAELQGGLLPFAFLMSLVAGLIILEHSFSVTIIILITGVTMFFLGGGNVKQLAVVGVVGLGILALLIWESGYGAQRVSSWWLMLTDPSYAPEDIARIMEMLRRGNGIGTNTENWVQKLLIPLLWSDYLFANIAADLGFPGTVAVVGLFAAFGYRGLTIALNADTPFGSLAALGVTTWILAQAAIHMGASLALIPATGIPLPFMSYGGSSLLACMAGVGLLLSISRRCPEKKAAYATFGFGWRYRRPRISDPGSDKRVSSTKARTGGSASGKASAASQPANRAVRQRAGAGARRAASGDSSSPTRGTAVRATRTRSTGGEPAAAAAKRPATRSDSARRPVAATGRSTARGTSRTGRASSLSDRPDDNSRPGRSKPEGRARSRTLRT